MICYSVYVAFSLFKFEDKFLRVAISCNFAIRLQVIIFVYNILQFILSSNGMLLVIFDFGRICNMLGLAGTLPVDIDTVTTMDAPKSMPFVVDVRTVTEQ